MSPKSVYQPQISSRSTPDSKRLFHYVSVVGNMYLIDCLWYECDKLCIFSVSKLIIVFFDAISSYKFLVCTLWNIWSNFSATVSQILFNSLFIKHLNRKNSAFNGVWKTLVKGLHFVHFEWILFSMGVSCKKFAFYWFWVDFSTDVSVFVIVGLGDQFSTA